MVTNTPNCTAAGPSGADPAVQSPASRDVSRFIADVIRTAGGPQDVALDLEKLGYAGRDGPYSGRTVRTWRAGARTPGSDLLFALARCYELSLDRYVFGERPQASLPDATRECQHERDRLCEALAELVAADEACDVEMLAVWPESRPIQSSPRRVSALNRARDLLP